MGNSSLRNYALKASHYFTPRKKYHRIPSFLLGQKLIDIKIRKKNIEEKDRDVIWSNIDKNSIWGWRYFLLWPLLEGLCMDRYIYSTKGKLFYHIYSIVVSFRGVWYYGINRVNPPCNDSQTIVPVWKEAFLV